MSSLANRLLPPGFPKPGESSSQQNEPKQNTADFLTQTETKLIGSDEEAAAFPNVEEPDMDALIKELGINLVGLGNVVGGIIDE